MSESTVEPESGAIRVSPLGAAFEGDVTEADVERLLSRAGSASRGCMFIIGDAINYAADKWGEKYERWIRITGLEYQTLAHAAWVASKIQFCLRRQNLTYHHHKLIAPLPPDQQSRWLELADKEGFSTRRLRKSLLLGRPATDEDMDSKPGARGIDNIHPHVSGIERFWNRLQQSGWGETATVEKCDRLLRDLRPVEKVKSEILELRQRLMEGR